MAINPTPPSITSDLTQLSEACQDVVEMLTLVAGTDNCIATQLTDKQLNVIAASNHPDAPIKKNDHFPLDQNLFCVRVIQSHTPLCIRKKEDGSELAYLGYPIHKPDGEIFGTFCIIDAKPVIDIESLQKYLDQGVEELYIDSSERLSFINKASGVVLKELTRDDISSEERVELTSQGMGIVAEQIFETHEVSEEIAQISQACVQSVQEVIQDTPKLKNLLKMLRLH